MFTTLVKNRICRGKNGFCCIICDVEIDDKETAATHINDDENHHEKLASFMSLKNFKINETISIEFVYNGIVPTSSREFKCTFCSCPIPKFDHIPEHIVGKKHLAKRRKVLPDSEIQNEISLYNDQINTNEINCNSSDVQKEAEKVVSHEDQAMNTLFCNHCQDSLQTNTALMYHKMFHLSSQNYQRSDIISFYITENTKRIYCLICDCNINNEEDLENHLKEACHIKRMMILCCPNKNTIVNMIYLSSYLFPNITIPPDINNIYNTLNAEFNRYLYYLGCNIHYNTFQQQPIVQTSHMNEHEMVSTNTSQVYSQQSMPQNVEHFFSYFSTFYCFLCSTKFLDENLLFLHYGYDYVHKYRLEAINLILRDKNMKFDTYLDNEVIKCLKCQIQLTELNGAVMHLFEMQHIVENDKTITDNVYLINNANNANMSRNMLYVCPICKINVTHDYIMVQHLESDYHKTRVQEYYANVNCGSFEKIIFFCPVCNMNFFSDRTLLDHLYVSHPKQTTNMIQTNNMILANPASVYLPPNNGIINDINQDMQQYFYAKYINSIPSNEANQFYNFINPNFSKDHQQKLQADGNKQRSSYMQNNERTLSATTTATANLTKNLIKISPRYVKLFVEIGEENIFKINPERIKKLRLGISLTFPYESNRGCIPCGCEISKDPQYLYEHLRSSEHETNLQELEENDEFFENYPDQFSDLELAKSYMHEDSDEWVKCLTCNTLIENHDEVIQDHINLSLHIKNCQSWRKSSDAIFNLFNNIFENLWYYIEKFFCNICCDHFEFEVDYARHLESQKHLKEVERRILRKQSLQFDCCILCSSFWYAKSDHHSIHCERDSHKYILRSRDFTVPDMPELAKNVLSCVEKTVNSLLLESDEICTSGSDVEKNILQSIEMVVRCKYPKVKAYLFGSRTSYLGSLDSDLDIYVDCGNQYEKLLPNELTQDQLIMAQICFHKYQDIWIVAEIITCTRIPIIRLRHRATNLNCDISFINGLSVEKSKIVGYYVKAYLPCRKLILYLKKWSNLCRLSGRKGINTFAISWMVIFYLQIKRILPSVWHLIQLEHASKIVAGWETGVAKTIPVEETDLTFEELLKGFFLYYAKFDYISDVACPFLGKIIKKSKLSDIDDLPEEMNNYKTLIKKEEIEFFRLDSPMCIQEPIDLSQNITKAVTKLHLRIFRQYCAESAVSLKSAEDDGKT